MESTSSPDVVAGEELLLASGVEIHLSDTWPEALVTELHQLQKIAGSINTDKIIYYYYYLNVFNRR